MTLVLFGLFFLFMLLGVPIAFAIGASTLYALHQSGVPLMVVTQQMFQGINSFALVAIPMFILAGDLMAQGKVSERLVSFADSLVGFMRGGLSVVSVMAGMFFAAISGSGAATTAAATSSILRRSITNLSLQGRGAPFPMSARHDRGAAAPPSEFMLGASVGPLGPFRAIADRREPERIPEMSFVRWRGGARNGAGSAVAQR